jgi:hypothetical protein
MELDGTGDSTIGLGWGSSLEGGLSLFCLFTLLIPKIKLGAGNDKSQTTITKLPSTPSHLLY